MQKMPDLPALCNYRKTGIYPGIFFSDRVISVHTRILLNLIKKYKFLLDLIKKY